MSDHPVPKPARTLTPEERREREDKAAALDEELEVEWGNGRVAWWRAARINSGLHEFGGWSYLGFTTLGEWLKQRNRFSMATYQRMVRVYNAVCVQKGIPFEDACKLDPTKVDEALPAIRQANRSSVRSELKRIQSTPRSELRRRDFPPAESIDDRDISVTPLSETDHELDEAIAQLIDIEAEVDQLIDAGDSWPAIDASCLPVIKEALAFRRSCLVNGEMA